MAASVGLRFYKIQVSNPETKEIVCNSREKNRFNAFDAFVEFVEKHTIPIVLKEEERTWFFEPTVNEQGAFIHGYVNYGTTGFESNLIDAESKKKMYRRRITDIEEIPLYFQFWIPDNEEFSLFAFQSFQSRSCVFHVQDAFRKYLESAKNLKASFRKLMPYQIGDSRFLEAPIKELRFIKKSVSNDIADRYLYGNSVDEVDYEVSIKSKRRGRIGFFGDLAKIASTSDQVGLLTVAGMEFDAVKASIDVSGKRKVVGLFGSGDDAGVIEVSDKVARGKDGHPDFVAISNEVDELMELFYKKLKGA